MVWLDGLDIPMVQLLRRQLRRGRRAPTSHDRGAARRRLPGALRRQHAAGRLAVRRRRRSPVFNYPYDALARGARRDARSGEPGRLRTGYKLRYVNPLTASSAMPTIGDLHAAAARGFRRRAYRSTDGTVFVVVEGEGETVIGDTALRLEAARRRSWCRAGTRHTPRAASEPCCSASPTAAQEKLGLWREQKFPD